MKTTQIYLTAVLLLTSLLLHAQLKVTSVGNVGNIGVQIGTTTPLSTLSIGDAGATDTKVSIYQANNSTALKVQRLGTSGSINFGINSSTTPNGYSPYWNYGIRGTSYSSSYLPYSRTYGVFGLAGNGGYGSYGLFGQLAGSSSGAAVVGMVSSSVSDYTDISISGMYAGYFYGDVKVTGLINGVTIGNSDKRYKKNIVEIDSKKTIDNIISLTPVEYNLNQMYIKTHKDSIEVETPVYDEKSQLFIKKHFGLIAQDLQKIYPDLVYEDANGYLAIEYTGLIPLLIQSIKELKSEVETLKTKNDNSSAPAKVKGDNNTETDILTYPVLEQNIPNPFNSDTQIGFSLPKSIITATLYVYDMNGVQLKSYPLAQRGKANITIFGSELTAGMYLYALIADGKVVDTKRMILTK